MPIYVKHGLAGYGPDLDETDEPYANYTDAAYAISEGLSRDSDSAEELAITLADSEEYEAAWTEHVRSTELWTLSQNFSPDRADAPLYHNGAQSWEDTLARLVNETFPLDVGNHERLYVWEVPDEPADDSEDTEYSGPISRGTWAVVYGIGESKTTIQAEMSRESAERVASEYARLGYIDAREENWA